MTKNKRNYSPVSAGSWPERAAAKAGVGAMRAAGRHAGGAARWLGGPATAKGSAPKPTGGQIFQASHAAPKLGRNKRLVTRNKVVGSQIFQASHAAPKLGRNKRLVTRNKVVGSLGPDGRLKLLSAAASIVNIIVGAGIFEVPSSLAADVGTYGPFAFAACAVAIGAIAICFAEGGSRVATSGGAYGYIATAFGPLAGFIAAILLVFSDVLACGGIAAALGEAVAGLAPADWQTTLRVGVITSLIGGLVLVNILGVSGAARLSNLATIVKLLPLFVFVVIGAGAVQAGNFHIHGLPADHRIGHGLILALFTFTGMEGALSASGEVRNPSRTIPRGLALAILTVTVLYMGIQSVAQGILGSGLSASKVPLADAMARISPTLSVLMLAGAAFSMFGWLCSDILCSPRILFALGRDGFLVQALGRLHVQRHTPYAAILCYGAVALALALSGTFSELAVLSALAVAPLYMAGCAAAWRLARRDVAFEGPPLRFRWLGAAALVGIVSMSLLIALGSWQEILGLVALLAASAAIYALRTRAWLRRALP